MKTEQERREERIAHRMLRCVHFTGVQNKTCEAGIRYDDFAGQGLPCLDNRSDGVTCEQRRLTTREESEAEIAAADASFARVSTCLRAIREKHGKARGLADSMPCPTGCGGMLRYSIAGYNGHVWGTCSTKGCAQWMQ